MAIGSIQSDYCSIALESTSTNVIAGVGRHISSQGLQAPEDVVNLRTCSLREGQTLFDGPECHKCITVQCGGCGSVEMPDLRGGSCLEHSAHSLKQFIPDSLVHFYPPSIGLYTVQILLAESTLRPGYHSSANNHQGQLTQPVLW